MLIRGDFDLNSVQNCTDSIKQRFKQTMLNQELAFMRQVCELHRLYRIQTAMMEDIKQKGMDTYNLHKGGVNSISIGQINHAKHSMAEFTLSESFSVQHEWHRLPGFTHKPVDLRLSADDFISLSADDFLGKGFLGGSLKESSNSRSISPGEVFDLDDLKLSLSIGKDAGKKSGFGRSRIGKKCSPSSEIIDVEDLNLVFSDNACLRQTSGFAAQSISFRDKHMVERVLQTGTREDSNGTPFTKTPVDISPVWPRLTLSDAGFHGYSREWLSVDHLSKNQTLGKRIADNLDLSMVKLEDSSCFSIDHSMMLNPSRSNLSYLSPTSWKTNVDHGTETHVMPQQLDLNVDLAASYANKINFIDLDADSGEELCNTRSNPKVESVGSLSKPSNGLSCDMGMIDAVGTKLNTETDAESLALRHSSQNQKATKELNCHRFSSSSESDIENQSSSVKTMQSSVKDLNISSSDKSQKTKMAHSGEQDQRSSDSTESNIHCISRQEPNVDELVQKAAESLVQISLINLEVASEFQNEDKDDRPQCSSDSYAAMVLKAKESDPDDYCVSSNAFVVDETENKENRHKLKRGTRMKDFQKDILPSLSILSRHEICEDINILEGILRSREYKKMRAKFTDGSDWSKSTRSKRSRVRYSRR